MSVTAVTASTTTTKATGSATPAPAAGDVMAAFLSMLLSIPAAPAADPRTLGEGDGASADARALAPEDATPAASPGALSTPDARLAPPRGLPSRLDLGVELASADAHGAAPVPRSRRSAASPVSDTPEASALPAPADAESSDATKPTNPGDVVSPLIGTPPPGLQSLVVPAAPAPAAEAAPAPVSSPAPEAHVITPASPMAGAERRASVAPPSLPARGPATHEAAVPPADLTATPPSHASAVASLPDPRETAPRGPALAAVTAGDEGRAGEGEEGAPASRPGPRHPDASAPALLRAVTHAIGDADGSSRTGERESGARREPPGARGGLAVDTVEATGAAVPPERPAAPVVGHASRAEDARTTPLPVVDQIASRVVTMRRDGQQSLSLRLDPPSLGTVHIDAVLDGKHLNVHIRADHAPTRELLDAALPRLRDSLDRQGFHASEVTVHLGLDGSPRQFTPERFAEPERVLPAPVAPRAAPSVAAPAAPVATGLVDLFV